MDELPETLTIANAAVHLLRLMQVTSDPKIFDPSIDNPKFEYIAELLEENPDKKLVVYTSYKQTATDLMKHLSVKCSVITGELDIEQRKKAIADFITGKSTVLIGTIGALGTGVDGLQKVCSTAIFLDCSWSPQMNQQAEDRLHRIGQYEPVDIYYLRLKDSVDQYVGQIVEQKDFDAKLVI